MTKLPYSGFSQTREPIRPPSPPPPAAHFTCRPRQASPPACHNGSDHFCHSTTAAKSATPALRSCSPSSPRHHPPVTNLGLPDRDILQYFSTPNLHSIRCSAGDAGSRSRASRRGFMFCTHAHSSGNRARRPRVRRRSGIRRLRRPPT